MVFILLLYYLTLKINYLLTNIDKISIILLLFAITYSIVYSFDPIDGVLFVALYAFSPIIFYFTGKYFAIKYVSSEIYYFIFLFLALSYSFIPAISIIKHIIEDGFVGGRNLSLIWGIHEDVSATILGSYFTMNMALVGLVLVQTSNKIEKRVKFSIIAGAIISLVCVLRVASLTQLGIASVSLLLTAIYLIFQQSLIRNLRLILKFIIIGIIIFSTISIHSKIFDILNERNNSEQYLLSASGRTDLWLSSIDKIVQQPFGGWNNSGFTYSHNLWLDVARVVGVIPLIFLLIFTASSIFLIYKVLRISKTDLYFRVTVLMLFWGFMAVFFVEPIIEGLYMLFLIFCLFIGLLSGYLNNSNLLIINN